MANEICKVYGNTEDEYIEYSSCLEKLDLVYKKLDVENNILNCNNCILSGRCTVSRENMFLGANTC